MPHQRGQGDGSHARGIEIGGELAAQIDQGSQLEFGGGELLLVAQGILGKSFHETADVPRALALPHHGVGDALDQSQAQAAPGSLLREVFEVGREMQARLEGGALIADLGAEVVPSSARVMSTSPSGRPP